MQAACHRGRQVTTFVLVLLGAFCLRPAAPVAVLGEPGPEDCGSAMAGVAPHSGGCSCAQRSVPAQVLVISDFLIWFSRYYLV